MHGVGNNGVCTLRSQQYSPGHRHACFRDSADIGVREGSRTAGAERAQARGTEVRPCGSPAAKGDARCEEGTRH